MKQNNMILRHMQDYDGITTMEAYEEYGCTRLSARIKDLRNLGYNIVTQRETRQNRYGDKVSYARYRLVNDDVSQKMQNQIL